MASAFAPASSTSASPGDGGAKRRLNPPTLSQQLARTSSGAGAASAGGALSPMGLSIADYNQRAQANLLDISWLLLPAAG